MAVLKISDMLISLIRPYLKSLSFSCLVSRILSVNTSDLTALLLMVGILFFLMMVLNYHGRGKMSRSILKLFVDKIIQFDIIFFHVRTSL